MSDVTLKDKMVIECTQDGVLIAHRGMHRTGLVPLIIAPQEHADSILQMCGVCGHGEEDGEPARVAGVESAPTVEEKLLAAFGFCALVMQELAGSGEDVSEDTIWGKDAVECIARNDDDWDFENAKPRDPEQNAPGTETIQ